MLAPAAIVTPQALAVATAAMADPAAVPQAWLAMVVMAAGGAVATAQFLRSQTLDTAPQGAELADEASKEPGGRLAAVAAAPKPATATPDQAFSSEAAPPEAPAHAVPAPAAALSAAAAPGPAAVANAVSSGAAALPTAAAASSGGGGGAISFKAQPSFVVAAPAPVPATTPAPTTAYASTVRFATSMCMRACCMCHFRQVVGPATGR